METNIPTYTGTLTLLVKNGKVLLFDKKEKIGAGCKNAPGGSFDKEKDKTHVDTAIRELGEECSLIARPEALEHVGRLTFYNADKFVFIVNVFMVREWQGEPCETRELSNPQWFDFDKLPLDQMLKADSKWLPEVLAGKKVLAEFWYKPGPVSTGPEQFELIAYELIEAPNLQSSE